jgi:UDP-glucose:(heptosyl)LPS alpha-1,3-glucosyltransferase
VRIAFVVHDYNRIFGHSRYVAELADRFAPAHEVHVFANRFVDLPRGIHGHTVTALRLSALTTILSFVIPASLRVGRAFDIVHAQGYSIRRPDVITAHISNARWLERRRHLEGARLSWRERLFGAVVTPLERRALTDPATTVIAVSAALRDDLATLYGRTGPIEVIHHGVDDRQFNPGVRDRHRTVVRRELGLSDTDVLFLYVGDLRKGFEPAIRALGEVAGARLLAISRSDPASSLAVAATIGLSERVHVREATPHIERYYAAADVFVLPTPYDAFGMVITEAMACGLPVITTPQAGAAELVTSGVHGYVVPDVTAHAELVGAMRTLATDAAARARMGAAAALLMHEHSWDRVAERTLAVYERHLGARSRS